MKASFPSMFYKPKYNVTFNDLRLNQRLNDD